MDGDTRFTRWGKRLLFTGGSQAAVQGIGFLSALLIIHALSTREYAYYTIAYSALGVMNVLTDGGICSAVMALAGRVWEHDGEVGKVLSTGLHLRRQFALGSLAVSVPLLIVLLRRQNAPWITTILITAAILVGFLVVLTNQVLEVIPRLRQQIVPLQKIQAGGAGIRLGLVLVAVLILPRAWTAALAAGLAVTWMNVRMRRWIGRDVDYRGPADPEVRRRILAQVSRTLPGAVYYAFLGQITVGLISIFGSNRSVANVGAAGRFAMLFGVVNSIVAILLTPRFARMIGTPRKHLACYWGILGCILAAGSVVVLGVKAFPGLSGFVLGSNYKNTGTEVLIAVVGNILAVVGGAAYTLGAVRGRILAPWIAVPAELAWQVIVVCHSNFTTARGVLTMGAWGALGPLMIYSAFNTWAILREREPVAA